MDTGIIQKSKIDAYIKLKHKGKKFKTKVHTMKEGGPPVDWNQEFLIPC